MRKPPSVVWPTAVDAVHIDENPEEPTHSGQQVGCAKCPPQQIPGVVYFESGTSVCAEHRTLYIPSKVPTL